MKLRTRFTLITCGITIFLIVAPILVFYARGFKFDFSTGQIIKTGTMVVRTEPRAKVFLNTDTKGIETPASIRFVLPGDYIVNIVKDGYHTWTKRLNVTAQFVTWASINREKIHLFLNKPKLLNSTEQTLLYSSIDNSEIAFTNEGSEYLIRVRTGARENLGSTNTIIAPLPDQAKIYWSQGNQIWQFLQTTNTWPIDEITIDEINEVHTNGKQTAILIGNSLYSFDSLAMTLIAENVSGTTLHNNELWYISNNHLNIYDFNFKSSRLITENLPQSPESKIIRAGNQIYLVIDRQLYQVRDNIELIYGPVTFTQWYQEAGKLLFGNGNEAYLHNPLDNKSELILRSLTPINQVQLNWFTGYILYVNDGKIKAAELDTRNGQNQFDILNFEDSRSFFISHEGNRLYLVTPTHINEYQIR
jgi:hypothetical protein